MITIVTAGNFSDLEKHYYSTSHYETLYIPERFCHANTEAKKIFDFVKKYKDSPNCKVYTLRETAVNVIGHMIINGILNNKDVEVLILPEGQIATYDDEGFLQDWPFGFYSWDIDFSK